MTTTSTDQFWQSFQQDDVHVMATATQMASGWWVATAHGTVNGRRR